VRFGVKVAGWRPSVGEFGENDTVDSHVALGVACPIRISLGETF
jgi:hypothetical protein